MLESGVVLSLAGFPLHWHVPAGRTGGSLPDSAKLWEVLWHNRSIVSGFAHSHPGRGLPSPSFTDLTTFAAIEDALGRRLVWPIVSADAIVCCCWIGPKRFDYQRVVTSQRPAWAKTLRRLSHEQHKHMEKSHGTHWTV